MRFPILLAGLAACGTPAADYSATLADFSTVTVRPDAQEVRIMLGDGMPEIRSVACPLLSTGVTGQLAGVPLSLTARGGKIGDEAGDDVSDNLCGAPTFQLDQAPPDGPSMLVLAEPTASITCNLPDLNAVRAMTSASWAWTPGQAVEVQWSPADDLTRFTGVAVTLYHQDDAGATNDEINVTVTAVAGDRIDFTVPALDPGITGSYTVTVSMVDTVRCVPGNGSTSGPVLATIDMPSPQFGASHAITITR